MPYSLSQIKEISHDRIIYYDNDDNEKKINLLECSKNWVKHYNYNINDYTTWEGNPASKISIENNKCVGERNWYSENPYFEFFSNPKIRFEIHFKKRIIDCFEKYWKSRYYKEFHEVSISLEQVGWTTFDLG